MQKNVPVKFELSKVPTEESFNVVSDKVFNFAKLQTKKKGQSAKKDQWMVKLLILFEYLAFKIIITTF